jgi:hypothetical protein
VLTVLTNFQPRLTMWFVDLRTVFLVTLRSLLIELAHSLTERLSLTTYAGLQLSGRLNRPPCARRY